MLLATRQWHPTSRNETSASPEGPPTTTSIPSDWSDHTAVIRWFALAGGI